ncbi:hypothetical protein GGS23DRAFT_38897 [Durotheca rogersii]|uniref:uncharacterized protein n=1 Tax=Durotheca rogersii TaxID=419775 RepID=UPI002221103B|nr:uncharacterized protein GGS23DRAFT_38897 [Durotheca rogersii]KAI5868598.1 hypothetical protein GGS23DRAFT_38897 [Durotheca rogersii]
MSSTSSGSGKPPRGILKKPSTAPPSSATTTTATSSTSILNPQPNPNPGKTEKPDPREVAIRRANIIQQQWELEDRVQDSIIELSRFPHAPPPSPPPTSGDGDKSQAGGAGDPAARPSASDAARFRELVRLFQPGDYEDLIEERNARGACGYALCPRPRLRFPSSGGFKLVRYGRPDFNIVPRRELERWCSQPCARRAMYVKVQLAETAAWERAGIPSIRIELLDDYDPDGRRADPEAAEERVRRELESLRLDGERKANRNARDLALERGDVGVGGGEPPARSVEVVIAENVMTKAVEEPSLPLAGDGDVHLLLDGYKTKFGLGSETTSTGVGVVKAVDEE